MSLMLPWVSSVAVVAVERVRDRAWIPALLAIAFVSWVILHRRLDGEFGDALTRRWRRGWPPGRLGLILLLVTSALLLWGSEARLLARVLPVSLTILGVSMIVLGGWLKPPASLDKKSLATAAA